MEEFIDKQIISFLEEPLLSSDKDGYKKIIDKFSNT